jgi:hypothetical protein
MFVLQNLHVTLLLQDLVMTKFQAAKITFHVTAMSATGIWIGPPLIAERLVAFVVVGMTEFKTDYRRH